MQIIRKSDKSRLRLELVPRRASCSFAFREFNWPRFPFNWHYHPELELTLIAKGAGLRFVGDSIQEFREGDLCLLGANLPHCWASHADAPKGARSLVIQFLPSDWGGKFWNLPEMRGILQLFDQASRGLVISGATRNAIARLMLTLTRQPPDSWQRLGTLLEMLGLLSKNAEAHFITSAKYEPQSDAGDLRLSRILEYVHGHLHEELSQRAAAAVVGMSPAAFSQFFKRSLRRTFVDYVNELRVHNACRALIESEKPVTEIAYAAGFNNLSHFHSRFRKLKGLTPQRFREAARRGVAQDFAATASDWLGSFR